MEIMMLTAQEVQRLLDPDALLSALAEGFKALSAGQVEAPKRITVSVPATGSLFAMPAYQQDREITVKLVSLFPDNARLGLPTHLALICLFDPASGAPIALMDGTTITALRTAGASALSARLLARPEARTLAIIGAGVQGRSHLLMLPHARPFTEIRIASRNMAHAQELAATDERAHAVESMEEAARGADVVCLCTKAEEPLIRHEWLAPGTHVTSVGYPGGELDSQVIARGHLFVETRLAFEGPPVGCAELAGLDPNMGTELGELLVDPGRGRQSDDELTVYKAMGHACEDMAAASLVYHRAKQEGAGRVADL